MEEIFEAEIMAIVPQYVDSRGNCTIVHRKNLDPLILDKTIKTVISLVGKHYMIDLTSMKRRYSPLLSSSNLIPIALSRDDIFIPFKTRQPMYKNDGAFSYINMHYIKEIKKVHKSSLVILDNGLEIKCLCAMDTVNKHLKNGKIISRCYEDRIMGVRESQGNYNSFIPATKADIEMINRKLEELVNLRIKKE